MSMDHGVSSPTSPTICSAVLILPPREAAMTARRSMKKRMTVMPSSRTTMRMVTHHHSRWLTLSRTKADRVSALSAIGSAILPKEVTSPHERASWPSRRSVKAATTKTTTAASLARSPGSRASQMKTGTSSRRSTVRTLAMLSSGACSDGAAPSGAVGAFIRSSLVADDLPPTQKPRSIFSTASHPSGCTVRVMLHRRRHAA